MEEEEKALRFRYLRQWGRDHAAYDRYLRFGEPFDWQRRALFGMRPEENMSAGMVRDVLASVNTSVPDERDVRLPVVRGGL